MFASLRLAAPIQAVFKAMNKLRGSLPDLEDALDLLELRPVRLATSVGFACYSGRNYAPAHDQVEPYFLSLRSNSGMGLAVMLMSPCQWVLESPLVGSTGGGKTTAGTFVAWLAIS